jgi:hypothetical protein
MPYQELFRKGTRVRIVSAGALADFRANWKLHNPLTAEQLRFAGHSATIASVGFYHGGDVLYELAGVPGIWHEVCLQAASVNDV